MTREEQTRKAADDYCGNDTREQSPCFYAHIHNAFLEGAEWADSHPQWIPVEERLPEENTAPLVRMDLTDKFGEETILYDVVVFDENGFHVPYKITHWMPIVPPRKEE